MGLTVVCLVHDGKMPVLRINNAATMVIFFMILMFYYEWLMFVNELIGSANVFFKCHCVLHEGGSRLYS